MLYEFHDGGRSDAGFKSNAGDCVTRAIAIATGLPYLEVYDGLWELVREKRKSYRGKKLKFGSPRNGVHRVIYDAYLKSLGWRWVPCMKVGSGCTVHLSAHELPAARLICSLSGHVCAVIDGVVYDTHDPRRDGTRCVYGYFTK